MHDKKIIRKIFQPGKKFYYIKKLKLEEINIHFGTSYEEASKILKTNIIFDNLPEAEKVLLKYKKTVNFNKVAEIPWEAVRL